MDGENSGSPDHFEPQPLVRTFAVDPGVAPGSGGASSARFMQTPQGDFLAKFPRVDGEGRRGPANELLATRLLERLGIERGRMALIELPDEIKDADPVFAPVIGNMGLGVARIDAVDVAAPVLDAARNTTDHDVLAQVAVLRWLQNNDHGGGNWMLRGDQLVAVDFAATPTDDVWRGVNRLNSGVTDHGGLNSRIDAMDGAARAGVRGEIGAITEEIVSTILDEIPNEWATADEKAVMLAELLRRKEELLVELQ